MISPNFDTKEFSAILKDLDGVLKKNKKASAYSFSMALTTFLTRHLMATAPNDFMIVSVLLEPYLVTRKKQIFDEQNKKDIDDDKKN